MTVCYYNAIKLYLFSVSAFLLQTTTQAQPQCAGFNFDEGMEFINNQPNTTQTRSFDIIIGQSVLLGQIELLAENTEIQSPAGKIYGGPANNSDCFAFQSTNHTCTSSGMDVVTLTGYTAKFTLTLQASAPEGTVFRMNYTLANCSQLHSTTRPPYMHSLLRTEVIIGIAVGGILLIAVVIVLVCCIVRRKGKPTRTKRGSEHPLESQEQVPIPERDETVEEKNPLSAEQPMYINVGSQGEGSGQQRSDQNSIYINETTNEDFYEAPISSNQVLDDATYMNM